MLRRLIRTSAGAGRGRYEVDPMSDRLDTQAHLEALNQDAAEQARKEVEGQAAREATLQRFDDLYERYATAFDRSLVGLRAYPGGSGRRGTCRCGRIVRRDGANFR